ncbi:CNH-domain-containing protein [Wallemia mellicola]|nr:CNH-domain-containing protein [Wallemia mellicola]
MSAARYLKRLERDKPGAGQAAAQASSNENFCLVGTPLPSLVDSKKDKNEYQPIWQQEVLDEQGRRRFHGAFTGGFSAGYFNTVGSKEGWTPSTWQSSRSGNTGKRARPEDFMDEEDLEALKEARVLETRPDYDLLAGSASDNKRQRVDDNDTFSNIFRPAKSGIGTLLMRKMGWRDGQGVGPRISIHKAKEQNPNLNVLEEHGEKHTFAPQDSSLMIPPRQIGSQGLGYAYTVHSLRSSDQGGTEKQTKGDISHGFGLGIEDADEDDIDIYGGPSLNIERGQKLNQLAYDDSKDYNGSATRQLEKQPPPRNLVGVEFFKDGKPLLKGFVLQKNNQISETWFDQPEVPKDWKPDPMRVLKVKINTQEDAEGTSKPIARDANDRARILGEEVPKKSVFDYVSAQDKQRLEKEQSDFEDEQEIRIPPIDKATASNALRASIPFPEGDPKRARYTAYLHSQSDPQKYPPDVVNLPDDTQTKTQFNIELVEFQKTASLFKPMTAAMAGRFTTGSRTNVGTTETPSFEPGLRPGVTPKAKEPSPPPKPVEEVRAERDAERQRNETPLQKAVPPPAITLESDDSEAGFQFGKQTGGEAPQHKPSAWAAAGLEDVSLPEPPNVLELERHAAAKDRNPGLKQVGLGEDEKAMEMIAKQTRPPMDIFKAIFNESDDEDEEREKPGREKKAVTEKTSEKKKKKDAKKRNNLRSKLTFDDGESEEIQMSEKPKRRLAVDFINRRARYLKLEHHHQLMSKERRSDAFQNIFGRPSASHHQQGYMPHQRYYQQAAQQQQQQQYYQQYYYQQYGYDYDQYYRSQSAMGYNQQQPYYNPSAYNYGNDEQLPTSGSTNSQYSSSSAYALPQSSSSQSYLGNYQGIPRVPTAPPDRLMEVEEETQALPPPAYSQGFVSGGPATTIATQAPPSVITEPTRSDTLNTPSVTPAQRANSFPSAAQTGASPTLPKITARSGSKNRREAIIAPRRSALNKIYPALLSRVAEAFKSQLPLSEKVKDDLTYTEAFDGSQAVDLLCQIIRTTDRNIALLLGRSLDAQKFFHDVHWEHRLRDSDKEIYRFKERIPSPIFADGENAPVDIDDDDDLDDSESPKGSNSLAPAKVAIPSRSASMPSRFKNKKSSVDRKDKLATSNKQPRSSAPIDFTYNEADGSEVKDSSSSTSINELPTGVFTLLTACYSPTCTKDRLCYSITCPRRIEQQHRMANRGTIKNSEGSLKRSTTKKVAKNVLTRESIGEEPVIEETITEGLNELNVGVGEEASDGVVKAELGSSSNIASDRASGQLWVESVPKEVVESCSSDEIKRQEAINEVIYTEQDFVRDLEYLRDFWMEPLSSGNIIPEDRRMAFLQQVFWNVLEIHASNVQLRDALARRQKSKLIVDRIGDVLLPFAQSFGPFVNYGSHQLYGKYEFEKEKSSNAEFAKFVTEVERKKESRKLELNGYLTKPTTRLARYPLLLDVVLKYTPDDHPDKKDIPIVVDSIRAFLRRVNVETGKSENRFNLAQLDSQLQYKPGQERTDLRLTDESRELVFKGALKKRGGAPPSESAELQLFLFDHAILLVKPKIVHKHEVFKVQRKPIPLEMLVVTSNDEQFNSRQNSYSVPASSGHKPRTLLKSQSHAKMNDLTHSERDSTHSLHDTISTDTLSTTAPPKPESRLGYSMTLHHLGRRGYSVTLWASTFMNRRKWLEHIHNRQKALKETKAPFELDIISDGFFIGTDKANCAVPYSQGRKLVYGTDNGIYMSDKPNEPPRKVIGMPSVTQIEVLEEDEIIVLLAERSIWTFELSVLNENDPEGSLKMGRKISSHTSFFKSGKCLGRTLVCIVKSSSLSSTIKVLEPIEKDLRNSKKPPTLKKLVGGGKEVLRVFKEFYIPTESSSIHFLRSKLCVGCTKGFEIVDLETLDTQGLLDPADTSLDFVVKREGVKPMAIYRVEGDFLLCYDDLAFYVNKNGWRVRKDWLIRWEGQPRGFAFYYPYILAFDPNFIEVRHISNGELVQVITGHGISLMYADSSNSTPLSVQSQLELEAQAQAQTAQQATVAAMQAGYPPHQATAYGQHYAAQQHYARQQYQQYAQQQAQQQGYSVGAPNYSLPFNSSGGNVKPVTATASQKQPDSTKHTVYADDGHIIALRVKQS